MKNIFKILTLSFCLWAFMPQTANAQCGCGPCGGPIAACSALCVRTSEMQTPITVDHITNVFNQHRTWMIDVYFKDDRVGQEGNRDTIPGILAAMQLMSEQLSAVAMQQVNIIGAMLDAKHQLETQRLFQQLTAKAHKDYHPSEGMCDIGTTTRSLMASERKGDIVSVTLSNRMMDRHLISGDVLSKDAGKIGDTYSRMKNFIKTYCNPKDNGNGLDYFCKKGSAKPERYNRDVNFTETLDMPLTLKMDLTKTETDDVQDLMALSANLYGHDVMPKVRESFLKPDATGRRNEAGTSALMDIRSLTARRSVAQNSLAAIAALKSEGSEESRPFIYAALKEMGGKDMDITEIQKYLGETPSYFAQMEILTKKIYQNPVFFTELYDKPANVMRKQVAVQAIELMQKRDMYASLLRSEAVFSMMLETTIAKQQRQLVNEINRLNQSTDLVEVP